MANQQTHTGSEIPNPIQIQKYLSGIDYPTDKRNLLKHAEKEGADDRVMDALRHRPLPGHGVRGQAGCIENVAGRREIPDHPLVPATLRDGLSETSDIEALGHFLERARLIRSPKNAGPRSRYLGGPATGSRGTQRIVVYRKFGRDLQSSSFRLGDDTRPIVG